MPTIKMLRNKHGSPDGYTVKHYEKDQEYDVPEALAKIFVEEDNVAEYVGTDAETAEQAAARAEEARLKAEAKEAEKAKKAEEAARLKAEKAEAAARSKAEKAEQAAKTKALKAAPQNKSA